MLKSALKNSQNQRLNVNMVPNGGNVIRVARKNRKYTQRELAEQYGVAKNTLCNWERGLSEPPFRVVFEMLEMMNYSIEEIYEYANGRR